MSETAHFDKAEGGIWGPTPPHRLVRAAAGTGKTYALTTQALALLQRGAPPETILATTFTRKAAGEILERLLVRLARAAQEDASAAVLARELGAPDLGRGQCRSLLVRLCRSLHRFSVSTLDSFFHRMAGCFRLELGLPPTFTLAAAADAAAQEIRHRALDALLDELVERDLAGLLTLLDGLYHGAAQRGVAGELERILGELYEVYREAPQEEVWDRLEAPEPLTPDELHSTLKEMTRLLISIPTRSRLTQVVNQDKKAVRKGRWRDFLSQGLAVKLAAEPPQLRFRSQAIPRRFVRVYRRLIRHARGKLLGGVVAQTRATYRLLTLFHQHYARWRQRERVLLFADLPWKLSRELPALGDELVLELYFRLDTRVGHLLLDEFQDTSLEQWRVLEPFAREIRAHGDGSRTFFCVGDSKQAIYGWRGGCPELFDEIERELQVPETLTLNTSYRSSQVVLDGVNRVFSTLAENPALADHVPVAQAWQSSFEPHQAHHRHLAGYVELVSSPAAADAGAASDAGIAWDEEPSEEAGTTADPAHDEFVAQAIEGLTRQRPGASVGVLMQTNQGVSRVLDGLRRRGVEASGEGGSPIVDHAAVALVLSTLTLAHHPGHSAAAFHVLHSPLAQPLGLESEASAHTYPVALAIRRQLADLGYRRVLASWARHLVPHCDERGVVRLSQLLEIAEGYEATGGAWRGDFVEHVRSSPVEEPSPSPVRVMTLHRSKGLEFDLVVLPDLDRRLLRTHDLLLYVERDSPTGPIEGVYRAAPQATRQHSQRLHRAFEQEQQRRLRDDLSGLYVAMTRARYGLYMFLRPEKPGHQASRRRSLDYASILRGALAATNGGEPQEPQGERVLYADGDPQWPHPSPSPPGPNETRREISPVVHEGRPAIPPRPPAKAADTVAAETVLHLEDRQERLRALLLQTWFRRLGWLDGQDDLDALADPHLAWEAEPRITEAWVQERRQELLELCRRPEVRALFTPPRLLAGEELELWRNRPYAVVAEDRLLDGVFHRVVLRRRRGEPVGADLVELTLPRPSSRTRNGDPTDPGAGRRALASLLGLDPSAIRLRFLEVTTGRVLDG